MTMVSKISLRAVLAVGVSSLGLMGGSAARAEAPTTVDAVVVTGTRASLNKALQQKRDAVGVVDGIYAQDIGKFPDLNVSESLQRISGVTINRSVTGEGNQVSLRGLPPEYTAVTLNGMQAATRGTGREFDFNTFASELFYSIRVTKTPSAELTEGGLAGTIDLATPSPFDFKSNQGVASVGGQYAQLGTKEVKPRLAGLYSWRNASDTFGLVGSVAYSRSSLRNDTKQGFRYETLAASSGLDELVKQRVASKGTIPTVMVNGVAVNDPNQLLDLANKTAYPILPRVGVDIVERKRLGVTGGAAFRPNDRLDLALNVLYAKFDERDMRSTIDGAPGFSGTNGVNAIPTSLTIVKGGATDYAVGGTFTNVAQRGEGGDAITEAKFWHTTLDGRYDFTDNLKLTGQAGYSKVNADDVKRVYLYTHTGTFTYDLSDPRWPKFSSPDFNYLNAADYTTPDRPRFTSAARSDEIYHGRGDLTWTPGRFNLADLKGGVEYTRRQKINSPLLEYRPLTTVPFSAIATTLPVTDLNKGAPAGVVRNFLVHDFDKARDLLLPDSSYGLTGPDLGASFVVTEQVTGAYAQSDWTLTLLGRPLMTNLGVRVARTEQTSEGYVKNGAVFDPISIDNNYTDVLPSLNLRWNLADDLVVRLSANKAITRPTLSQLSAGITVNSTNTLTATRGNPSLKPFRAYQYDAALEWYFARESLLSATAFYKDMQSFIVTTTVKQVIDTPNLFNDAGQNVSGSLFNVTLPVNGTGGELYGLELGYQQPFSFLPKPFDGLGVLANLTLSHSKGQVTQGGILISQRLQGQSNLSYNLVGYYEKGPISLRAAWAYRSDYADQFRAQIWASGTPHTLYVDDRGQLDLSARYQLNPSVSLFVDAINVNSSNYYSYDTDPGMSRDYFEQGPVYNFGVRARF